MLRIITLSFIILFASNSLAGGLVMKVKESDNIADYSPKLTALIKEKLASNSGAEFNVVTMLPKTGKRRHDMRTKKRSTSITNSAIGVITGAGVAPAKIFSTLKNNTAINEIEVHVFEK